MKWFKFFFCFATSISLAVAEEPASNPSGPRIVFDKVNHDFGTIERDTLRYAFKFKNAGNSTLEIKSVQPGCNCTVIPDYDKKVEPGKEGQIKIELDTSKFNGHVAKGVTVTSNDPNNPILQLSVTANIEVELEVIPQPEIWFNQLQPNTATNQTVEIKSMMTDPLVVEKVESSVPWLTAAVVASTSNSAQIEVSTKPPLASGMQTGKITAHTTYKKFKDVVITVTAQVPATITAIPSRVMFLQNQGGDAVEASVLVSRNDGKDFHIKSVDTKSALITSALTTNTPGRSYRVHLTYLPKGNEKPASNKVEIQTDEPEWPKLEIPYVVR